MFYVQPHPGLECFCVFPPAAPGVIHIKPHRGFREKYNSDYKLRILLEYFGQMYLPPQFLFISVFNMICRFGNFAND